MKIVGCITCIAAVKRISINSDSLDARVTLDNSYFRLRRVSGVPTLRELPSDQGTGLP